MEGLHHNKNNMSADSLRERAWLLLQEFKAALAAEASAREEMRAHPGDPDLMQAWLRAMDATHEASRKLREETRS